MTRSSRHAHFHDPPFEGWYVEYCGPAVVSKTPGEARYAWAGQCRRSAGIASRELEAAIQPRGKTRHVVNPGRWMEESRPAIVQERARAYARVSKAFRDRDRGVPNAGLTQRIGKLHTGPVSVTARITVHN